MPRVYRSLIITFVVRRAQVEVEVQHNAYGPSDTQTQTFRVAEAVSRRVVEDIRTKLRLAPHGLEHMFRAAEEGVEHEVKDFEEWTRTVLHPRSPQVSPTTSQRPVQGGGQSRDGSPEDEGWMSDQSTGEPSGSGGDSKDKSRKPKVPKIKVPKPKSKRVFMRRGILGHRPHTLQRSQSEDFNTRRHAQFAEATDDERTPSGAQTPSEETRGRTSAMRSPRPPRTPVSGTTTPVGPNPHLRLAHRRIDSIRSELPSREMSPARSVRFADDGRGGTSTPRIVSPTTPTTADADGERAGEEDDESPKSTVRFSLPGPEARQAPLRATGNGEVQ